jgi:hypothetical protein
MVKSLKKAVYSQSYPLHLQNIKKMYFTLPGNILTSPNVNVGNAELTDSG